MHEILLFICDSNNFKIIKDLTNDEIKCIENFINSMSRLYEIATLHIKFYEYTDSIINTSELIKSNDDTLAPTFAMTPFIQPRITITHSSGDDIDYVINIV